MIAKNLCFGPHIKATHIFFARQINSLCSYFYVWIHNLLFYFILDYYTASIDCTGVRILMDWRRCLFLGTLWILLKLNTRAWSIRNLHGFIFLKTSWPNIRVSGARVSSRNFAECFESREKWLCSGMELFDVWRQMVYAGEKRTRPAKTHLHHKLPSEDGEARRYFS